MAWTQTGTNTLSTSTGFLEVTGLTKTKFNQIISHVTGSSASYVNFYGRVGNGSYDTGSNYSSRECQGGTGAENLRTGNSTFNAGLQGFSNTHGNSLHIIYNANFDGEEKLFIEFAVLASGGGTTAPFRYESYFKNTTTSGQIDQFKFMNDVDTYDADSNITVLGTD